MRLIFHVLIVVKYVKVFNLITENNALLFSATVIVIFVTISKGIVLQYRVDSEIPVEQNIPDGYFLTSNLPEKHIPITNTINNKYIDTIFETNPENPKFHNYEVTETTIRPDFYEPLLISIPKINQANNPDLPPINPYISLLLSRYGRYVPLGNVPKFGIYAYSAINNLHNNKPFGSYKLTEDH